MKNADFDQAGWREGARAVNEKENFSQSRRRSVGLTRANSAFSPSSLDLDLESPPPSFTSFFSPSSLSDFASSEFHMDSGRTEEFVRSERIEGKGKRETVSWGSKPSGKVSEGGRDGGRGRGRGRTLE